MVIQGDARLVGLAQFYAQFYGRRLGRGLAAVLRAVLRTYVGAVVRRSTRWLYVGRSSTYVDWVMYARTGPRHVWDLIRKPFKGP